MNALLRIDGNDLAAVRARAALHFERDVRLQADKILLIIIRLLTSGLLDIHSGDLDADHSCLLLHCGHHRPCLLFHRHLLLFHRNLLLLDIDHLRLRRGLLLLHS